MVLIIRRAQTSLHYSKRAPCTCVFPAPPLSLSDRRLGCGVVLCGVATLCSFLGKVKRLKDLLSQEVAGRAEERRAARTKLDWYSENQVPTHPPTHPPLPLSPTEDDIPCPPKIHSAPPQMYP